MYEAAKYKNGSMLVYHAPLLVRKASHSGGHAWSLLMSLLVLMPYLEGRPLSTQPSIASAQTIQLGTHARAISHELNGQH